MTLVGTFNPESEPYPASDDAPEYTAGQEWYVLGTDADWEGLSLTPGDILRCVVSGTFDGGSEPQDPAGWQVTPQIVDAAEAVLQKPTSDAGAPIGYGDWRLTVQALLPSDVESLWGVGEWGDAAWSSLDWVDLSPRMRGLEWTRGADDFAARPEVGFATLTLDNNAGSYSPWNPENPYNSYDGPLFVTSWWGPGTLVRVVAFSPSGMIEPYADPENLDPDHEASWVPQFTGVVESWIEETVGQGADSWITVTLAETLTQMAQVDDNAVSPVGNNDLPAVRMQRLGDAAGWRYGYLDAFRRIDPLDPVLSTDDTAYQLQSTEMADNRIAELYLTADSVGAVIRTARDGRMMIHNSPVFRIDCFVDYPATPDESSMRQFDLPLVLSIFEPRTDADSVQFANDDTAVLNVVRLGNAGDSQRSGADAVSRVRFGTVTYERSDLIGKSDDLLDFMIDRTLAVRAFLTQRVVAASLHGNSDFNWPAIIGLDIGDLVTVTHDDDGEIGSETYVNSITHRVTALRNGVVWTADFIFGTRTLLYSTGEGS